MAEIKTRISLKYDSLTNWQSSVFNGNDSSKYLKAGEVAIVTLAPNKETNPTATANQHPLLFKVGTGAHKFDDLPWASALAADVYDWAKQPALRVEDLPTLPLEVIDEGTGKFVISFTYADNKLTITRSDVAWDDVNGKPNLVNSVKVTDDDVVIGTPVDATSGDVTIDIKHKAYNKAGATTDVAGDATTAGSSVTIKVPTLTVDAYGHTEFTGETSHTITIPNEVAVGDGNITITAGDGLAEGGSFNANQDGDATITIKHADTSNVDNVVAADRTYVKSLTFDDFGHVTGVDVGTEVDQNLDNYKTKQAEYTKTLTGAEVLGTVTQNANGEINVTARTLTAADLGLDSAMHFIGVFETAPEKAFVGTDDERELENGDVYLNTINSTEFVYSNGAWVEFGNENSHALKTITITGEEGLEGGGTLAQNRTIGIKNSGVTTAKIADEAVTEAKLAEAVATKLNKQWQPVGNYKVTQEAVTDQITDAAHVLTSLTQDANGVIDYEVKKLTPADIGAQPVGDYQPAGDYATKDEVASQNAVVLAEAQEYTDNRYTAAPNGGLKLNEDKSFAIDDSIIFMINCGTATTIID